MPGFPVLTVCLGNLCRSPYAERLLARRLADAGAAAGDFAVTSAGLIATPGTPMHPEMAARLERHGLGAAGFASRLLTRRIVEDAGLVLTATRDIRSRVLQETPSALRRTFTLLELADLARVAPRGVLLSESLRACGERRQAGSAGYDLVDPIGRGPEVFDAVAAQIDDAVAAITDLLVSTVPDNPGPVPTR